jgi:excisionase family DNA binding protein
LARISIEVDALEELLEGQRRLEAKVDALSIGANRKWFSTKSAAEYLSTTEVGIRSLVQGGKLQAHRNGSGKLMIEQQELDRHAQAGDNGR